MVEYPVRVGHRSSSEECHPVPPLRAVLRMLLRDPGSTSILYDNYGRSSMTVRVAREMESFLFDLDRVDTRAGAGDGGYINWSFEIDTQHDDAFPRRLAPSPPLPPVVVEIQLAAFARCLQRTSTLFLDEVGYQRGEIRLLAPPDMLRLERLINHLCWLRLTDKDAIIHFDFDSPSASAANSLHAHVQELDPLWIRTQPQRQHTVFHPCASSYVLPCVLS